MVNGRAVGFFKTTRGVRQGDSLSPCLLITVMELLSGLLIKASDLGLVKGLGVGNRGLSIETTHLLFAHDTIIFCQNEIQQLIYL